MELDPKQSNIKLQKTPRAYTTKEVVSGTYEYQWAQDHRGNWHCVGYSYIPSSYPNLNPNWALWAAGLIALIAFFVIEVF